jgi:hypothetical protein
MYYRCRAELIPAGPPLGARLNDGRGSVIDRGTLSLKPALAFAIAFGVTLGSGCTRDAPDEGRAAFERTTVAPSAEADRWGKAIGDVNNDGRLDLIVTERAQDLLIALIAPDWKPETLLAGRSPRTGIAAHDMNGDGRTDIVATTDKGTVLLHGPDWRAIELGEKALHDVLVADLNGDQRPDIVGRGQSAFRNDPPIIDLFLNLPGGWSAISAQGTEGEGLLVADLDADGRQDIVLNNVWLRNRATAEDGTPIFDRHQYASEWRWPHTKIAAGDLDHDGRLDIVLAPAEPAESHYRLSWFRQPERATDVWTETVLVPEIEAVLHGLQLADLDGDGRLDVVVSAMHQGDSPEVAIYFNDLDRASWPKQVLGRSGSHNLQAADIDGDGDVDLFGANWSGSDDPVTLWRNQACDTASLARVRRHVVAENREGKNLFVLAADLDRDGYMDIAAGPSWYRNPHVLNSKWNAQRIGADAANVLLLHDFDRDGAPDMLYTTWSNEGADPRLGIAWNDGQGAFSVSAAVTGSAGDFPQGVAVIDESAEATRIAVSWHDGGGGVELVEAPTTRSAGLRRTLLSASSQDEDLSAGDIDRDGDVDLLLGTIWLEQTTTGWVPHRLSDEPAPPDRNELIDMDGDVWLDAVIGFEAISKPGEVAWYRGGPDAKQHWSKHSIANVTGPMSLSVAASEPNDAYRVIIGEHNLTAPNEARLLSVERVQGQWQTQTLWTGDEHHDGLIAADLDRDGDLDYASVGWSHGRVHVYEELALRCRARALQP